MKIHFKLICFLILLVLIVTTGCDFTTKQTAKEAVELGMAKKYGETFQINSVLQENLLPFGGNYKIEAIPLQNPKTIVQIEYQPNAEIKILDDYQNSSASTTMKDFDKKKLDQIFASSGVTFDSKCAVYLDYFPEKIDTSDAEEISKAIVPNCRIIYCSYFLVDSESEAEEIKRIFESNLDYFKGSGINVFYSIAFCNRENKSVVEEYFNLLGYWNENEDFLYGYYDIQNSIDSVEDLRKSYVEN